MHNRGFIVHAIPNKTNKQQKHFPNLEKPQVFLILLCPALKQRSFSDDTNPFYFSTSLYQPTILAFNIHFSESNEFSADTIKPHPILFSLEVHQMMNAQRVVIKISC